MAVNKAKRPLPMAQPQRRNSNSQPVELMPVKAHVYRAMAELNTTFEKLIQDLKALGQISFFHPERITAMSDLICRARAQANRDCLMAMHDRETVNTSYFDLLCAQWEKEAGEPTDR